MDASSLVTKDIGGDDLPPLQALHDVVDHGPASVRLKCVKMFLFLLCMMVLEILVLGPSQ